MQWKGPHDLALLGGWCHSSAGYVYLWAAAGTVLGEDYYNRLAIASAEHCWSLPQGNGTLCCGLAGQGYAMLEAHRLSGDQVWRGRAAKFAQDAVRFVSTKWCTPNSLYKGDLGIALLAGDLADPSLACMPMFGPEGWPRRPTGKRIVEEADGRVAATEP